MRDFTDDLERAQERLRKDTIHDKEYAIRCTDPYGMWHVEGKNVPEELQGSYTSAEMLWQKIKSYEDGLALLAKQKKQKV